jgi:hypothetical protein
MNRTTHTQRDSFMRLPHQTHRHAVVCEKTFATTNVALLSVVPVAAHAGSSGHQARCCDAPATRRACAQFCALGSEARDRCRSRVQRRCRDSGVGVITPVAVPAARYAFARASFALAPAFPVLSRLPLGAGPPTLFVVCCDCFRFMGVSLTPERRFPQRDSH